MNSIIGIDPGLKGGIAVLIEGQCADLRPMPTCMNGNGKRELDAEAVRHLLAEMDRRTDGFLFVYIEDVHSMPQQGIASTFKFGYGAGRLRGIAEGLHLPVRLVNPVRWKNVILSKDYTHDKEGAIAYCRTTFPETSLVPTPARVPQDGLADALCIAQYGWREHDGCA